MHLVMGQLISAPDASSNGVINCSSGNAIHSFIQHTHADPFTALGPVLGTEVQGYPLRSFGESLPYQMVRLRKVSMGGSEVAR